MKSHLHIHCHACIILLTGFKPPTRPCGALLLIIILCLVLIILLVGGCLSIGWWYTWSAMSENGTTTDLAIGMYI